MEIPSYTGENSMPVISWTCALNNFICSEMTVDVTVVDINDNAPRFDRPTYTANIPENAVTSTILTFVARDEDSTSNGMITYIASNLSSEYIII